MKNIDRLSFRVLGLLVGFFMLVGNVLAQTNQDSSKTVVLAEHLNNSEVRHDSNPSITLQLDQVPLKEALKRIAEQAETGLYYNTALLPEKTVSLHLQELPLDKVLRKVLAGTSLRVITSGRNITLRQKMETDLIQLPLANIQETVTGTVIDAQSSETIPGVNILVKGTTTGASTDEDGTFELTVESLQDTLVVSFVGYQTQEVPINGRTTIDVEMISQAFTGEELVVVGFGTREETSLTGSVSSVSGEEISATPVTTVQQALQGKVSGLTVFDKGGSPTNPNQQIVLRGANTLYTPSGFDNVTNQQFDVGANQPLVLVDGVEQPYQNVNPDNIESISVLKDASSTAIYGARAANGVILITTKRGTEGDLLVSYHGSFGLQKASNKLEHMDLEPYMRLQNVAHINVGGGPEFTEEQIQNYLNGDRLEYPLPYDWQNTMYKVAPQTSHSFSLDGGSEDFTARANLRFKDQDGIITNITSQTIEGNVATDFQVSPSISIKADLTYRNIDNREPHNVNNVFRLMTQNAIWTVPKYLNGNYGGGEQGNNPLLEAEAGGINSTDTHYFLGNIDGNWEIIDGLEFSTQFAIDYDIFSGKDFERSWQTYDGNENIIGRNQTNELIEYRNEGSRYTLNNTLNYALDLGVHSFEFLGGYSQIRQENSNLNAYRQDFYINNSRSLSQGVDNATVDNFGLDSEWALRSFFGRFNYSYQDKYLLEVNGRYDGSSRFIGDNQYSFFPSFSAGWRLSQENFWSGLGLDNYINEFKLRGSWGETGKETVALYSYVETMNLVNYAFGGGPVQGIIQQQQANEDLTWETTAQIDLGVDAKFLNNKFSLTVDYYVKTTEGILLTLPVPGTFGLEAAPQNAGEVENKGWEFSAGVSDRVGQLSFDANFNFTINKNKVLDLVETGPFINNASFFDAHFITAEGLPINSFWGYKTDGLFQSDEEAQNHPQYRRPAQAGDVKFLDLNNDGVINPDDMTYLGNSFPTYTYGANFNFNYKSIGLSALFQGVADAYMRYSRALAEAGHYEGFTPDIYTGNYWTPDNRDARFARPTKRDVRNQVSSDRMLIDSDYLRLKNLQLSYQLPSEFTNRFSVNEMKVYVSGTNLFTFSDLNKWNLDPEATSGLQNYYPQTSVYSFGLRLQF